MYPTCPRRRFLTAVGSGVIVGTAGCLGGGSPPSTATVEATDDLTFEPETATIAAGGTVTWRNVGSVDHTVTAYEDRIPAGATYFASGGFESEERARTQMTAGLFGANEEYTHRFEVTGEYDYYCIPHESAGMTGTILVK